MLDSTIAAFQAWYDSLSGYELFWIVLGFVAQFLFMMRFIMQWIYSERARRSIVPEVFWYFSILGGVTLLAYAIHRADPVFIAGQALGLIIYARNIYFIWHEKLAGRADAGKP
ncbi:MAG: lipid-A-disaccharide synthase N-terminal domain-containing protein [Alphaproteobacteria bacterium]|nr:lipid-A-disaccharide synthase N-terminal domain-containing protein [Alphaproteobacteria bacterium]MCB9931347.1 lipid-A-disaccharide synthase N-terminal domain-containing protein [Alphaproteobacteria bacterium]